MFARLCLSNAAPFGGCYVAKDKVTRRLAAILAADVVGYSRLVGDDEEGTIARLRAIRDELIDPSVARY